jgi:hypothetical protein
LSGAVDFPRYEEKANKEHPILCKKEFTGKRTQRNSQSFVVDLSLSGAILKYSYVDNLVGSSQ